MTIATIAYNFRAVFFFLQIPRDMWKQLVFLVSKPKSKKTFIFRCIQHSKIKCFYLNKMKLCAQNLLRMRVHLDIYPSNWESVLTEKYFETYYGE